VHSIKQYTTIVPLSTIKQNVTSENLNFSSKNIYLNFYTVYTIRHVGIWMFRCQIGPTQMIITVVHLCIVARSPWYILFQNSPFSHKGLRNVVVNKTYGVPPNVLKPMSEVRNDHGSLNCSLTLSMRVNLYIISITMVYKICFLVKKKQETLQWQNSSEFVFSMWKVYHVIYYNSTKLGAILCSLSSWKWKIFCCCDSVNAISSYFTYYDEVLLSSDHLNLKQ